jgi:hypothetical protein
MLVLLGLSGLARAHDGLELEPPRSEPDAWNMIRLCRANMGTLVKDRQLAEIPIQVSLSIQALRYLREHAGSQRAALVPKYHEAEEEARLIYRTAEDRDAYRTPRELRSFDAMLAAIGAEYPEKVRQAEVYGCPMCRGVRELDPEKPCFKCGMALSPRIIPASSLYEAEGEPSVLLTPLFDAPLQPGVEASGKVRLTRKKDKQPVTPPDLLIVHTERIHLLIIDDSLRDYHHEHPRPTDTPGEYAFRFTPEKPGPYRIFADITPALSNVQEYAPCDVPAASAGEPVQKGPDTNAAEVDGLHFALAWDPGALPLKTKQPARATVTVTDRAGQPFVKLEPIMGTYAHVVAFHENRRTVLHIHPLGATPQRPEDRGGPSFVFQVYAPMPGYYRFYAQVQVEGRSRFAGFDVNVGN